MCGIVGSILRDGSVVEGLVEGLRLLEYRGYDSSGVAVVEAGGEVRILKRAGRLENLERAVAEDAFSEPVAGIGHTRWATHGAPTDLNAHPHGASSPDLALVHNGIFENYQELKAELEADGVSLRSETDTEVLAHMIERSRTQGATLVDAVRASLLRIRGYYAVAVVANGADGPELVCARQGPPLAIASTPDGTYLASDPLGLVRYTREIVYLEDGDVAKLVPGLVEVVNLHGRAVDRRPTTVDWDPEETGKGPYRHFMLKEIHEQPEVVARTAQEYLDDDAGDVHFPRLSGDDPRPCFHDEFLRGVTRVQIIACGTALHAGWIARYMIEGLVGVPVDVDFASEFRYRDLSLVPGTMALAISQSGETADTLAAMRKAAEHGASTAAICNVAGSTQARDSEHVILTKAGPEIGVASTKAFTSQLTAAYMLAVRMGRARGAIDRERGRELLTELRHLKAKLAKMVSADFTHRLGEIAERQVNAKGFLFLGRGLNFPVALEGALKLKEISYMHAEGYAAGEMKHGPIAMIEPWMTSVVITGHGLMAEKVRSNIEQIRARGGPVIAVGSDPESLALADEAIEVPESSEWLSPLLNVIPLQLLSYEIALLRGCDIDKPRNLAKSVTVE